MKKLFLLLVLLSAVLLSCTKHELPTGKIDVYISCGYTGQLPTNFNVIGYVTDESELPKIANAKGINPQYCWCVLHCEGCGRRTSPWYGGPAMCDWCGRMATNDPPCYFGWAYFPSPCPEVGKK